MAGSKKKVVIQRSHPIEEKKVGQDENPDQYYAYNPSWNFKSCDAECWALTHDLVKSSFWNEILPHLQSLESQKWSNILIDAKKQNHSIDVSELNKVACNRLEDLMIESESIISLRLTGKHRLYGYITRSVFNILWVDFDHGDNKTCVCRSKKKHT